MRPRSGRSWARSRGINLRGIPKLAGNVSYPNRVNVSADCIAGIKRSRDDGELKNLIIIEDTGGKMIAVECLDPRDADFIVCACFLGLLS